MSRTIPQNILVLEEARRKKHKMHLVKDATLAKAIASVSEKDMYQIMLDVYAAKGLASLVTTVEVMDVLQFK